MVLSKLFTGFFESERAGGVTLVACTALSLTLANLLPGYAGFWDTNFGGHTLVHWINDGLMAIFFLLIGLELEREIYAGELSSIKAALLPVSAALGGILIPAGLYMMLNYNTPLQSGAGIPMATDIAFAIGILSLLGSRVPAALKVFITAFAIADDIGAILIIAFFYTQSLSWIYLLCSLGIFAILGVFNRLKVYKLLPYLVGGFAMWYCMLHSGVHASITGVLLAFAIPFGNGDEQSISYKLQHFLHIPVAFFILPIFALANTAIPILPGWEKALGEPQNIGIALGLIIGKPLGITLFSLMILKAGYADMPEGLNMKSILGAGLLGGIGFTMSIFICMLAFPDAVLINNAKIMILISSFIAGTGGYIYLRKVLKPIGSI
ncbi:MAG: Na+/H+ antiporter NhaA [Chitinophagaceae bacterium]|nr:MAG: Na+/H+ antiporter NhaA [Chitinophagaceae bacterium]